MKVIIIDDYKEKLDDIAEFIKKYFPNYQIFEKYSYQSGLKAILTEEFNLILLDMSMPTYDIKGNEKGGPKKAFAGKEILRQMKRKDLETSVIVITQFNSFRDGVKTISINELSDQLSVFENYKGMIHYNSTDKSWKIELLNLIKMINA